jgi:serine/threonine protein kinase
MTRASDLHTLYLWFDRLMDLSEAEQAAELRALRETGNPLALQLEGMLLIHRQQNPTESPFTIDELLSVVQPEQPWKMASDLRELSRKLFWSEIHACFQLGHFSLIECLSVSTIGATYRAHDQELDRDVALLLVFPRWSRESMVHGRTLESSRAVAKVFHPHVAAILGTMHLQEIFAVVRQWVPGQNLGLWLEDHRSQASNHIGLLVRGIALGLQAIHDEGVLHGDLKPTNIIMKDGLLHPVITDFGTATWISSDQATLWQGGTRGFVAPEILRGEPPTPQSDLYSLGVILQWMTTNGESSQNVPDDLLPSLLASDPKQRPASAKQVADQIGDWIATDEAIQESRLGPGDPLANQTNTQRSHGGTRPLLWDRLNHRRAWIGHTLGLGLTAVASSWAGSSLASMRPKEESAFIPGFAASFNQNLRSSKDLERTNLQFLPNVNSDSKDDSQRADLLSPVQSGKWSWLPIQEFQFPFVPKTGKLHFVVLYDCDPGMAHYRVECRASETDKWIVLAEGSNFFGGRYDRTVDLVLPRRLLSIAEKFQSRIGIMYERSSSYPTELPPIALFVRSTESFYEVVSIQLWDSIYRKSENDRGLQ